MNINRSSYPKISILLSVPYITFYLIVLKEDYSNYLLFISFLLWIIPLIVLHLQNKTDFKVETKYILWGFFLAVYFLLALVETTLLNAIKLLCFNIVTFVPVIISDYYISSYRPFIKRKIAKFYLLFCSALIIYLTVITSYYLNFNPNIARYLTAGDNSINEQYNVPSAIGGGYNLAYALAFILPIIVYITKHVLKKNVFIKVIFFVITILLVLVIIKMNFTIAFLIAILFSILSLLSTGDIKKDFTIIVVGCVMLINIYILSTDSIINIVYYISEIVPNTSVINQRLLELVELLDGNQGSSSIHMRVELNQLSWHSFLDHPFIGVGYEFGFDYTKEIGTVGHHSTWLDILARFGLIGSIPYISFILLCLKKMINITKGTIYHSLAIILVCMFITMGYLNPILNTSIPIVIFLLFPCLVLLSKEGEKND